MPHSQQKQMIEMPPGMCSFLHVSFPGLLSLPSRQDSQPERPEPPVRNVRRALSDRSEKDERIDYEASLRQYRDDNAKLDSAIQKGIEKEANRIARALLGKGADLALISECTGLSLDEVRRLVLKPCNPRV